MAAETVGRRVVVTGLAGSGKSTLSTSLGAITSAPVIHLDLHFWRPGWVEPTAAEWVAQQQELLAGDKWIADGNYTETLPARLALADTVVVLDTPWWHCIRRAIRRGMSLPSGLPEGCEFSRWQRFRDELGVAGRTWRKRSTEPDLERRLIAEHAAHATVHRLRSSASVERFLAEVGRESATGQE